jgi:hypothetical protein
MIRLYSLGWWSCVSLALALAVVATLAVPEEAFADSGSCTYCASACTTQCGSDNTCYENCMASCTQGCCTQQCNGDTTCMESCCEGACGSDQTCLQNCCANCKDPCWEYSFHPDLCNSSVKCKVGLFKSCVYSFVFCACTGF